ncbi:MAG: hypothetical protein Q8933_08300 [Bacteroidota bacterium]|nr:hypothetical protein [Bacteroidota bacterium]MDP4195103.1 hypothetical protein [Bacteroidota bacterium]
MEFSTIVFSILAIVATVLFIFLFTSFLIYKIKQKENAIQKDSLLLFKKIKVESSAFNERTWH